MEREKTKFVIQVNGYGTFEFIGNLEQAKSLRENKARWEKAVAHLWDALQECQKCNHLNWWQSSKCDFCDAEMGDPILIW